MSYSDNMMYNVFKRLSQGYSGNERAETFHASAVRIYRMEV